MLFNNNLAFKHPSNLFNNLLFKVFLKYFSYRNFRAAINKENIDFTLKGMLKKEKPNVIFQSTKQLKEIILNNNKIVSLTIILINDLIIKQL